ncbi:MAG TPA: DMT family transporter [Thermoplasmata archaeon]|nr:DMT family transporter [Thermoplasmata archaeon]
MNERGSLLGIGLVLVFLTAFISGVSTFVNAYAVGGTNSDAFVTVRNIVVALAFVPVALLASRYLRAGTLRRVDWARLVIIGLIGGAIPFLLFFHGLQLATKAGGAVTASFAYRTLFLFATVFGLLYLSERFHWWVVLAAGLILGGNVLLLSLTAPVWTDGTAYVLAATVLWAAEYTISKRALRDLPSATVALGRMGFGAVFLAAYLAITMQWGAVAGFSGSEWAWVGISAALLCAFVASWYPGLKRVELGPATSVLVLGFPITWLLGILVRGSRFTLGEAVGAVAVVAGVAVAVGLSQFRATGSYLARLFRPETRST